MLVPLAGVAVCLLVAAGAAGSDRADLRSVVLASAWVLVSSAAAPVVWSLVRSCGLTTFLALSMGLSMGRVMVFGALAGLFAWLVGVEAQSFWITFFAGSGAMLVAEKGLAVAAAWPAVGGMTPATEGAA